MDIVIGNGEIFERKVNDARLARIDTRTIYLFPLILVVSR